MKDYILKIVNYNHWANEALIEVISQNNINDEYILKMLSHILNAQRLWFNRINKDNNSNVEIWKIYTLENIKTKNDGIAEIFVKLVANMKLKDFNKKIEYQTQDGETYVTSIADILIHLASHDAHHRGQIAAKLRTLGINPPQNSYIQYVRSFPEFW
jgi:uncharacterized damage-inducible protein DinB